MPKFKYTARDSSGRVSSGSIEAPDHAELRRILRVNDLYLTRFRQTSLRENVEEAQPANSLFNRTKPRDVVVLIRQMSTLVRAGVPLATSLVTLHRQAEKPQLQQALRQLQEGVVEGRPLSSTMQKHSRIFSPLTVSLVEAGEVTGTLDQSLEIAAQQLDREEDLRSRVKAALVYPKIVVAAAAGTIALMLILVVPVFKQVYDQFHGTLPTPTLALIKLSDFVLGYWWALLAGIALAWYGAGLYRKTENGARFFDTLALKIPAAGPVLRKVAIARFTQTLATGLRGGVPVLRALQLAAGTSGNTVIREAATGTISKVREGEPLAQELERTGQFPPMVTQMIRSGETSGTLDQMLDEVNRYYDEDIRYAVDKMTKLLEPVMTGIVGGIVLFVLLALYMPVFNMGKTVLGK